MKKIALFLLALTAAACSSDEGIIEPSVSEVKGTPIELTAIASDNYTKSTFDGQDNGNGSFGKLQWSPTDKLGIYYEQSANITADGNMAVKWAVFTYEGPSQKGDGSAHFGSTEMTWNSNPDITRHQLYGFYPVADGYNELNVHESPYEKAFSLSNDQSIDLEANATQDEIAAAAKTNYEKHQILISNQEVTVTPEKPIEKFTMEFTPVLSYLCLHVYADNAAHAEFPEGAQIYLSRISVMGPQDTYLTGDFAVELKSQAFLSEKLGSTRGINIAFPGNGLLLERGDRTASKPIYAVMLPVNLNGKQIAINGVLTVVSDNGSTVKKYQLTTKYKNGVEFKKGTGYDIYVKAQPGDDVTDTFGSNGFIFRSNGKWYNFAEFIENNALKVDETSKAKYAQMASDLYFIKTDGTIVTSAEMDDFNLIGSLVNAVYEATGSTTPINVDMSNLQMQKNQFEPAIFGGKDVDSPAWGSFAMPEGIEKINNEAFANCINLKAVTLPNSLTRLSKRAFYNCKSLIDITIPDHLNTNTNESLNGFMEQIFEGCTSLTYVNLPANIEVTEVPDRTFLNCTALKDITIPNNISTLGPNCFTGCTALSEITIRNRVKVLSVSDDTFTNIATNIEAGKTPTLYVYKTLVEDYKAAIAAATGTGKGWDLLKDWTVLPIVVTADSDTPDTPAPASAQ